LFCFSTCDSHAQIIPTNCEQHWLTCRSVVVGYGTTKRFKLYSQLDNTGFVPEYDQAELGESQLRMNGKSLIISLLETRSARLKLNVFKEARAEIWKIFRLVYVDGQLMPYAVCIQCMKPVAYSKKTTGSLHKHACASAINKLWSKSVNRKRKGADMMEGPPCSSFTFADSGSQSMSSGSLAALSAFGLPSVSETIGKVGLFNSSMHNIHQAIDGISGMSSLSNLQKLTSIETKNSTATGHESGSVPLGGQSDSALNMLSHLSTIMSGQTPVDRSVARQLEILNQQFTQNSSNGLNPLMIAAAVAAASSAAAISDQSKFSDSEADNKESSDKSSRMFDLMVRCLSPLNQCTLDALNNTFQCSTSVVQMQAALQSSYSLAVEQVKRSLSTAQNLFIVLDFWNGCSATERYVSIWAVYESNEIEAKKYRQILSTLRLNTRWTGDQIRCLVEDSVAKFVDSNRNKFYVLENCPPAIRSLMGTRQSTRWLDEDTWIECTAHQLQTLLNSILSDSTSPLMQTLDNLSAIVSLVTPLPDEPWIRLLITSDWQNDWRLFQRLLRVLVDEWALVQSLVKSTLQSDQKECEEVFLIAFEDIQTFAVFMDKLKHEFDVSCQSSGVFGVIRFRKLIRRLVQDLLGGNSKTLRKMREHIEQLLSNDSLLQQPLHIAAHCLRPESKDMSSLTNEQRATAQQWLNRQFNLLKPEVKEESSNGKDFSIFNMLYGKLNKTNETEEEKSQKSQPEIKKEPISSISKRKMHTQTTRHVKSRSTESRVSGSLHHNLDELQMFLDGDFSQEAIRDHKFWQNSDRAKQFPNLAKIAASLAAIESTPHCCCISNRGASFATNRLAIADSQNCDQMLFLHTYFVCGAGSK
jgi:hypothetical protein